MPYAALVEVPIRCSLGAGTVTVVKSPFVNLLGLTVVNWDFLQVSLEMAVSPEVRGGTGALHGGAIAALVDIAGAMAGSYSPAPDHWPHNVVSLSMNVNFVRPAFDDVIFARGRKVGGGRTIFMSTVEITDAQSRLVATGQGTFKFVLRGASARKG
jgi:uncharacterized protein (TIGR00369 family)